MSGAFGKNSRREIKNSLGRYLAIMAIVALGVGFFSGLQITHEAMLKTADAYVNKTNMFDYQLISTMGLTEDDVASLGRMEGVLGAEGSCSADVFCALEDGSESVLKLHSLPKRIGMPMLVSGRMPVASDECVVDSRFIGSDRIGESLLVCDDNEEDTLDMLRHRSYKIVGTARSVNYLNIERGNTKLGSGTISGFAFIPADGFECDYFTEIYLDADIPGALYSEEYKAAAEALEGRISEALEDRGYIRYRDIVDEANEELEEHRQEYEDGLQEYKEERAKAEKELDDALYEINTGAGELYSGYEKLPDMAKLQQALTLAQDVIDRGQGYIDSYREEYIQKQAEAQQSLAAATAEKAALEESAATLTANVDAAAAELAALQQQLAELDPENPENAEAIVQLNAEIAAAQANYDAVAAELEAANWQIAELTVREIALQAELLDIETKLSQIETGQQIADWAEPQVQAGIMDILIAREELEIGSAKLWDATQQYEEGKAEAEKEFAEAEAELKDAEEKIAEAQQDIDELEPPDTYVLTREENIGYACFENDSTIIDGMAKVFPLFFFMVAALVCMTTMTRMIGEQRTQIGTLKALGYSDAAILWKYISYSGSSALIGGILGYLGGTRLFPYVIWVAYGIIYGFTDLLYAKNLLLASVSLTAALLCSVGTTWIVCRRELSNMPAELMRPKAPKAGKRIFLEYIGFIWKRLGFLPKVALRNIFRYKGRLIMMLLGVGGCTALVLTGFGIHDSIRDLGRYQFDEIAKYDYTIIFSEPQSEKDMETFRRKTESELTELAFVCQTAGKLNTPSGVKNLNIIATDAENITELFDLHTADGSAVPYPGVGELVMSERIAHQLGAAVGDTVCLWLDDKGMDTMELRLSGICKNYVQNYAYMTASSYEAANHPQGEIKYAYAASADGADIHGIAANIMNLDGVLSASTTQDMRDRVDRMMNSMNYVVLLVIICAAALAFIVLINLSNINITERQREIATIKVLGFYPNETASYVFRENLILTAFGAVVGIPMGELLHRFVMTQIKVDMVSFDTVILPESYVLAIVLTMVFTVLVDILMRRKLAKIDMAQSLKSVE